MMAPRRTVTKEQLSYSNINLYLCNYRKQKKLPVSITYIAVSSIKYVKYKDA